MINHVDSWKRSWARLFSLPGKETGGSTDEGRFITCQDCGNLSSSIIIALHFLFFPHLILHHLHELFKDGLLISPQVRISLPRWRYSGCKGHSRGLFSRWPCAVHVDRMRMMASSQRDALPEHIRPSVMYIFGRCRIMLRSSWDWPMIKALFSGKKYIMQDIAAINSSDCLFYQKGGIYELS